LGHVVVGPGELQQERVANVGVATEAARLAAVASLNGGDPLRVKHTVGHGICDGPWPYGQAIARHALDIDDSRL
jgi:hypothetical protein